LAAARLALHDLHGVVLLVRARFLTIVGFLFFEKFRPRDDR
jgi:hypothetical protein